MADNLKGKEGARGRVRGARDASGARTEKAVGSGVAAAGRPAAFEAALSGGSGWGLTASDVLVAVLTAGLAIAVCCVLWFGYGVEGVPGVSSGTADPSGSATAVDGGDALVDAAWDPSAPQVEVDGGSMGTGPAPGEGVVAGADELVAVIQNSAGFVQVLPLSVNTQVTVVGELGTNVVEVRSGSVRCKEADCSNQVCVDTGWISGVGQMIVCLPHQLTVQVVRDPADAVPLV